jgi:hypothetical protein
MEGRIKGRGWKNDDGEMIMMEERGEMKKVAS